MSKYKTMTDQEYERAVKETGPVPMSSFDRVFMLVLVVVMVVVMAAETVGGWLA